MGLGLLLTALGLGIRHGIDWDHIAAIADLSGTAENRRQGFWLSMLYAIGHAVAVFALGTAAIAFGLAIPDSVDNWMGRIVGVTLIALGIWILVELVRKGRGFRLRSRWMLIIDGTFAGLRRVRSAATGRSIEVEHSHGHEHEVNQDHDTRHAHDHAHLNADVYAQTPAPALTGWRGARARIRSHGHAHPHTHELALPTDVQGRYGNGTAAGIGVLHGIGVESPTQIAIFVASTSAAGVGFGLVLLTTWIAGLLIANAGLAIAAGTGLLHAERSFPIYAGLAIVVSIMSIALGTLYLIGLDVLPGIVI